MHSNSNSSRVYVYMFDLVQNLCGRQLKPGQPDHRLIYEKARYNCMHSRAGTTTRTYFGAYGACLARHGALQLCSEIIHTMRRLRDYYLGHEFVKRKSVRR